MALNHVVALAGGVGGAKLALGLTCCLEPDQLTVIVNTGDDFQLYGLAISPDLDTVMYTLSRLANPETGWGVAGDTVHMLDQMRRYGGPDWFRLGDRDLATHLYRTTCLAEGQTLTEVTGRMCTALGIAHPVLPMTDDPVRTAVETVEYGWLDFQEYFVRHRWQPTVTSIAYRGAEQARLSDAVRAALDKADVVVICPSNPLLSVAPMLAIPGMIAAIGQTPVIAVSPIVAGAAIKGPAAQLFTQLGRTASAPSVAAYYGDLLAGFVLDVRDGERYTQADFRCPILVTDTIMRTEQDKCDLAHRVLVWAKELTG